MAVQGDETRSNIIHTAMGILRREGYHGMGVQKLARGAGIPRGSLYFHFPGGKDEIVSEAIGLSTNRFLDALEPLLQQCETPQEVIDALFQMMGAELKESAFEHCSSLSTVALETANKSPKVQEACQLAYQAWEEVVGEKLASLGLGNADELATGTVSALEGALMLAQLQKSLSPLRSAQALIRRLLEYST